MTELHKPVEDSTLREGELEGRLAEQRSPTSYMRTAFVSRDVYLLTDRADLAAERELPATTAAMNALAPTASVNQAAIIVELERSLPCAGRTGVDIDRQLCEGLPTRVNFDLSLSSVACHTATDPALGIACLVREGAVPSSGGIRAADSSAVASETELLDSGNLATVERLLGSWDIGTDPRSWRGVHRLREALAHQPPDSRPIRKLPSQRPPPQTQRTRETLQSFEPSVTAIPAVQPVSETISVLRPNVSQSLASSVPPIERETPSVQTQIEPGVYGSRTLVKRKSATQKRRPGGF